MKRRPEARSFRLFFGLLLVLAFLTIMTSLLLGTVSISVPDSFRILGSRLPIIGSGISLEGLSSAQQTIVLDLRLPRTLMAFLAGMGLAVAGCIYQGIFSNPMADPYLLGVSSGAALGATMALFLPISSVIFSLSTTSVFAFGGALLVLLFVFTLAKGRRKMDSLSLILAGVTINYFISALIALLMLFNRKQLESVYFWTLGSFKDSRWGMIGLTAIVLVVVFVILYRHSRALNLIMLGEDQAKSLGVSTERVKKLLLGAASLLVAVIVANCGIIGFVGLIIPHGARMLVGPDHKRLLPFSLVLGGVFMLVSDTLARSLIPNMEISVGIITSLFGVPFFLLLLLKNRRQRL